MKHYILLALLASSLWGIDEISIRNQTMEIKGQKLSRYAIDGRSLWNVGDTLNLNIANDLGMLTALHFQGLPCPNQVNGTPYLTGAPITPDQTQKVSLTLTNPGSYFFVGSFGLQQQNLLTSPLVVLDPQDNRQQVIMLLEDFSFKQPGEIWQNLREHVYDKAPRENTMSKVVLSEIKYDAYLTNKCSLENPYSVDVQEGLPVRVRIMNASSMTPFFISTGALTATVLAVDAQDVAPVQGTLFEMAPGQRLDLELPIPLGKKSYPILAEAQGTNQQTGLILHVEGAPIPRLSSTVANPQGRSITFNSEFLYSAVNPLPPKTPDRKFSLRLGGDTFHYVWSINGVSWPKVFPLPVKLGERVEITFSNESQVIQTLSLHGHIFQIMNISGTPLKGAMRDTLYILPQATVTIQFDANNPGVWPLTSQNLYHRWGGLMTEIFYEGFKPRYFTDTVQEAYYNRYGGREMSKDQSLESPGTGP
jgi:FtsP/CotA-like multicopper oxidase with cupredoxin domain